ncbi:MAG: ABC transporter permease [Bacilli bacterium]
MSIILSAIKRGMRDKSTIISNVFLALILPYIFSVIFSFESVSQDLNLQIIGDENSKTVQSYVQTLKKFDKESKDINLTYKVYDKNKFKEDENIESNSLRIVIDEKNREISLAGNKKLNMAEEVVSNITEEYFNSMSLYEYIAKEGSSPVVNKNIIKTSEYKSNSTSAFNMSDIDYGPYFAVIMLEMAIVVSSITSFKNTFYIKENIGNRVKSSPKKIFNLLSQELIGSFIVIFAQGVLLLGAISIIYDVNLTLQNIIPVLILIGVLSILAVCLGIFTTAIAKKRTSGENICSMVVTAMALASGKLMPQMSDQFEKFSLLNLNPFVGISKELNSLLTYNTSGNLFASIVVSLVASAILMIISTIIIKRKVVN